MADIEGDRDPTLVRFTIHDAFTFKFKHYRCFAARDVMRRTEGEAVSRFTMIAALGDHLSFACPSSEFTAVVTIGIPKRELVGQHFKKRLEITRCPAVSESGEGVLGNFQG